MKDARRIIEAEAEKETEGCCVPAVENCGKERDSLITDFPKLFNHPTSSTERSIQAT